MNRFLDKDYQIKRLTEEWIKYGSLIVAYDFDNTVFDYHNTQEDFTPIIKQLQVLAHMGCKMICFSCSDESRFPEMRQYMKENLIPCHGINIDTEEVPFKGRKIFYNVFYDDRAGLAQVYDVIKNVIINIDNYTLRTQFKNKSISDMGKVCHYSGQLFRLGEWEFYNKYPAAYPEYRKENDIIPDITDIMKLFKR